MGKKEVSGRQTSVATKISVGFGLLILFLFGAVGAFTYAKVERIVELQFQEKGEAIASAVATLAEMQVQSGDYVPLNALFTALRKNNDVKEALVINPGGKILAHTDSALVGKYTPEDMFARVVHNEKNLPGVVYRAPIKTSDGAIFGYFYIEMNGQRTREYGRELLISLGLILLAAVYAGFMLARIISARVLKQPVEDLLEATRHISTGNFAHKVPVRKDDELGNLARAFNTMIAHLSSLFRTVSTSTEEMAKSSQIILSRTENYLSSAAGGAAGPEAAGLAEINSAARRLARVVDRLHSLSRQFKIT